MNREDFLSALSERIQALPADEKNTVYEYYNEIILDNMDSGMDEAEVIAALGDIDDIAAKILSEYVPEPENTKEAVAPQSPQYIPNPGYYYNQPPIPPKRSTAAKVWIIIGLVLGSPIWLSLLLAFFAVVLSVAVAIVSAIASFWVAAAAVVLSGLLFFAASFLTLTQNVGLAFFQMGIGLVATALGVLMIIGMVALTQVSFRFLKWMFKKLATLFRPKKQPYYANKEEAK